MASPYFINEMLNSAIRQAAAQSIGGKNFSRKSPLTAETLSICLFSCYCRICKAFGSFQGLSARLCSRA